MNLKETILLQMNIGDSILAEMCEKDILDELGWIDKLSEDDYHNLPGETREEYKRKRFNQLFKRLEVRDLLEKRILSLTDTSEWNYPDDTNFQDVVIDHVDFLEEGVLIKGWQGFSFLVENPEDLKEYSPGSLVRFYPSASCGVQPYGLFINGRRVFYNPNS